MIKTITVDLALQLKEEHIFVDTRTPKEFEIDNIPGSINIPIFSNEERVIVGTLYNSDKIKAYQEGFQIYNKKILDLIEEFKKIDKNKKIIIYCWRGGMRSKTMTELISNLGLDVVQLTDGYKEFRKFIREELQKYKPPFKLIVLQGLAGCGKTDLIKGLTPSIDLEGLAKHRSSVFGALGLEPVSQKMFESRLFEKLQELKNEKIVFIEGEAKKVGDVFVPNNLFEQMQKSQTINITCSIEERSKRIVKDYFTHNEDEKIKEIIIKLKVFLSNKHVEELNQLVDEKEYLKVAQILLEDHYDPQYNHALKNQVFSSEVKSDNIVEAIKDLNKLKE